MTGARRAIACLALAGGLALGPGAASRAQDTAPGSNEPSAKRLDRFEKELREVRQIVLQAHATGQPVEIKEAGPDPQVVALQSRLDDEDTQIRRLTGEIETLAHDLAQARKDADDQRAQTASLADRLDKLEKQAAALAPQNPNPAQTPPAPPTGPVPSAAPADAAVPDAKSAYAHARQLLENGDYPDAATEFQAFLARFSESPSVPAARYWLGEAEFIQKDYQGAATAYLGAIRGWPKTTWAPEAVVKLSQSLLELGKPKDACGALSEFDRRYPKAASTQKARAAAIRARAQCSG